MVASYLWVGSVFQSVDDGNTPISQPSKPWVDRWRTWQYIAQRAQRMMRRPGCTENIWFCRNDDYGEVSHPRSLSCPDRMLRFGSLSFSVPNLIYWFSSALRNLNFVVLSKQRVIWGTSPKNREFFIVADNKIAHSAFQYADAKQLTLQESPRTACYENRPLEVACRDELRNGTWENYQPHTFCRSGFFEGLRACTSLFIGTNINGTSAGIDDYDSFSSLKITWRQDGLN